MRSANDPMQRSSSFFPETVHQSAADEYSYDRTCLGFVFQEEQKPSPRRCRRCCRARGGVWWRQVVSLVDSAARRAKREPSIIYESRRSPLLAPETLYFASLSRACARVRWRTSLRRAREKETTTATAEERRTCTRRYVRVCMYVSSGLDFGRVVYTRESPHIYIFVWVSLGYCQYHKPELVCKIYKREEDDYDGGNDDDYDEVVVAVMVEVAVSGPTTSTTAAITSRGATAKRRFDNATRSADERRYENYQEQKISVQCRRQRRTCSSSSWPRTAYGAPKRRNDSSPLPLRRLAVYRSTLSSAEVENISRWASCLSSSSSNSSNSSRGGALRRRRRRRRRSHELCRIAAPPPQTLCSQRGVTIRTVMMMNNAGIVVPAAATGAVDELQQQQQPYGRLSYSLLVVVTDDKNGAAGGRNDSGYSNMVNSNENNCATLTESTEESSSSTPSSSASSSGQPPFPSSLSFFLLPNCKPLVFLLILYNMLI
ncbi:unnamed protein product [Trichogramma brassicae]|uniref:Uncharacterized protein n=1 Tax=Trichogramma brassicae TaxID=86971 RepID=A0A6H5IDZ5_9HYME|nr:unnamed protein product [Trichogramma brassicae]